MDAPNIGKNGSNRREATAVVTEKGITQTPRVKRWNGNQLSAGIFIFTRAFRFSNWKLVFFPL